MFSLIFLCGYAPTISAKSEHLQRHAVCRNMCISGIISLELCECLRACLCVLLRVSPQRCSRLEETPISPALPVPAAFRSAQLTMRRRCDSSCDEASSLIPPTFPPSFLVLRSRSLAPHTSYLFVRLVFQPWLSDLGVTVAPLPLGQNKA